MAGFSRAVRLKKGEPPDDNRRIIIVIPRVCRFRVPILPVVEGVLLPEASALRET
jgi:hypothetical protein